MNSQQLDKRVRFERPTTVTGDFGQRLDGWDLVAEVWAGIRPMGSKERMAAFQMQSGGTHVVTARHRADLAALRGECRILFKGRGFNIIGLPRNLNERNEWLVFDCSEGGADGH